MTLRQVVFASLILYTSEGADPAFAVKQFLEATDFADKAQSIQVIQGQYVVRYTLDGPKTLTA